MPPVHYGLVLANRPDYTASLTMNKDPTGWKEYAVKIPTSFRIRQVQMGRHGPWYDFMLETTGILRIDAALDGALDKDMTLQKIQVVMLRVEDRSLYRRLVVVVALSQEGRAQQEEEAQDAGSGGRRWKGRAANVKDGGVHCRVGTVRVCALRVGVARQ